MPHEISSSEGDRAKTEASSKPPFGPGFDAAVVSRVEKLEVTGSSFNDPGGDWVEFTGFDASGEVIATRRIAGY